MPLNKCPKRIIRDKISFFLPSNFCHTYNFKMLEHKGHQDITHTNILLEIKQQC
jgi:hypothetical protein